MPWNLSESLQRTRRQVREFMDGHVLTNEARIIAEDRRGEDTTLRQLQVGARAAGLRAPHLPADYGGLDLGVIGMCALFREMGRSLVGPRVFNCDAPDQGNMDLLLRVAGPAVRQRWLKPMCDGEITSAFCMTEPAPGAGADPHNLQTTATADGEGWRINGRKWFATGGGRASMLIVMARTSDDRRRGATLFAVDRQSPGIEHVRTVGVMAEPLLVHREAELQFNDVQVGTDNLLGEVGQGFELAQARLIPARLTHCMRWLGLADRALDLCRAYVNERQSFGRPLARHQLVQQFIANGATAIHAGDLLTWHCARVLGPRLFVHGQVALRPHALRRARRRHPDARRTRLQRGHAIRRLVPTRPRRPHRRWPRRSSRRRGRQGLPARTIAAADLSAQDKTPSSACQP